MQTIGLLGGMSWESTVPYYRIINEAVRQALGGLHSARIILHSVDFHDVERLQNAGNWTQAGEHLADAARAVEAGGADFLVLCTNTVHKVAPAIARGAQGIVLGCTEIAMLVGAGDAAVPVYDTALMHAQADAARALSGRSCRSASVGDSQQQQHAIESA